MHAPLAIKQPARWRVIVAGICALILTVGLARFAYTALMPQMVLAGWFTGEQVAYLGAANLLGYLIGALAAAPLAERLEDGLDALREAGLLTRDSRMKERKKYGRRGARRGFQFSKR